MAEEKQKWDGRISTRVPSNSFPELFEDLSHLSHRHRGDRLRSLATVGLAVMKNLGKGIHSPVIIAEPEKENPEADMPKDDDNEAKISKRRDSLIGKANF